MKLETAEHVARESRVAEKLATAWNCTFGRMGEYSPFDLYLMREKRLFALVEVRTRGERTCHGFDTVLLNLDKWFTLMQSEIGLQIPGYLVVAFSDGIWALRIGTVPVHRFKLTVRGRVDRPGINDVKPVIEVPSSEFFRVCDSDGVFE